MKMNFNEYLTPEINENGGTTFIPLRDKITGNEIFLSTSDDNISGLKPIYIPKMYISSNSYRTLFKELHPDGKIKVELLHRDDGSHFSADTQEKCTSLSQEIVKVSLFENDTLYEKNIPMSEGIGAIVYRGEVEYNNVAVATAQGKAFSAAMRNAGYCIPDTEIAFKEILSLIDAFIQVGNSNGSLQYQSIGKASDYYEKMAKTIYKNGGFTPQNIVVGRIPQQIEDNSSQGENEASKASPDLLALTEMAIEESSDELIYDEPAENVPVDSFPEDIVPDVDLSSDIIDSKDVIEEEIDDLPDLDSFIGEDIVLKETIDQKDIDKALNTTIKFESEDPSKVSITNSLTGRTFNYVAERKKGTLAIYMNNLEKHGIIQLFDAKTLDAFNILKSIDFKI